jgi:hypothetical protein
MKAIKISILAVAMVLTMQAANAQISFGVRIGAPYHRVYVAPRPYGYYEPAYYYHPYAYSGYYARPAYHPYYRARLVYRRRW